MKSLNRNSSLGITAALLAVLTVATVMAKASNLLRPSGYAGKATFEIRKNYHQIQGFLCSIDTEIDRNFDRL